ncbi:MAG: HepT-like ribonuclease domain-containing protein [bacterium]
MTPHDDILSVAQMLQFANDLRTYTKGRRREVTKEGILRDAVLRKFEVFGEAATRISADFRTRNPDVPWKRIIAFRNVLIHAYDRLVGDELLVALDALPGVVAQLKVAK